MEGLIEIKTNENMEQLVSARELYSKLGLADSQWKRWYQKNIIDDEYFKEGTDYIIRHDVEKQNLVKGRPSEDFIIKIDMAKELCMLARTENGKKMRSYFIEVEKQWNSPEKVMARALIFSNNKINMLQDQNNQLLLENKMQEQVINEMKRKVDYTDEILRSKNVMNINQIAKDYGMSGQKLNSLLAKAKVQYKQNGQWLLYSKYQDKGYTHSNTIKIVRRNGQDDIRLQTKWTQKGRLFIYKFMVANGFYPLIEQEDKEC